MVDPQVTIAIVTLVGGFLIGQAVVPWIERRRLRNTSWDDLLSEVEANIGHQNRSTYISLEDEAYGRFRTAGFFMEQDEVTRTALQNLYSHVHEKNEMILYYRAALPAEEEHSVNGKQIKSMKVIAVVDAEGKNPVPVTKIISDLSTDVTRLTNEILPKLKGLRKKARDPYGQRFNN